MKVERIELDHDLSFWVMTFEQAKTIEIRFGRLGANPEIGVAGLDPRHAVKLAQALLEGARSLLSEEEWEELMEEDL